ncbi:hypothetical protein AALP_AA1G041600 [Arabis alpina]|uniref:Uncharacterized protein n=1 Tax=Arabis alpina TaxID=50452 RepID=A0A087HL08_ARAAL|nr:hypothetical protein AALP_AA1G041600 [Arabis alpina]
MTKELRCSFMYSDLLEWREHNPPPATIMLISYQRGSGEAYYSQRHHQERLKRVNLPCFIADRAVFIPKPLQSLPNISPVKNMH